MFCFIVKYDPMTASSYLPLPKELKEKQGCLDIQNNDRKFFLWSIIAPLHPVQHRNYPTRVSKYQEYEHELNMSWIQYPGDIKDIGQFEHQNNISVNVYGYQDKKKSFRYVLPLWPLQDVNSLCITAGEKSCYVLVKDLSRLVLRK